MMKKNQLALRKPRKLGRRSLYTPRLQRRICQLLEKGNTITATCDHVGITTTTFHQWCEDKPDFFVATSRARGKARVKLVKVLADASKIDWRAAGWLLSHCWPEEYSETSRLNIDARHVGVILLPQKENLPP
jgi:hypothetical protein